jgi:hypothetical protein
MPLTPSEVSDNDVLGFYLLDRLETSVGKDVSLSIVRITAPGQVERHKFEPQNGPLYRDSAYLQELIIPHAINRRDRLDKLPS